MNHKDHRDRREKWKGFRSPAFSLSAFQKIFALFAFFCGKISLPRSRIPCVSWLKTEILPQMDADKGKRQIFEVSDLERSPLSFGCGGAAVSNKSAPICGSSPNRPEPVKPGKREAGCPQKLTKETKEANWVLRFLRLLGVQSQFINYKRFWGAVCGGECRTDTNPAIPPGLSRPATAASR